MKSVAFVDAGQFRLPIVSQRLNLKGDERFDWEKFKSFLESIASSNLNDVHYFDARNELQHTDNRQNFHQFLRNSLGFQIHFTQLKERHRPCPHCRKEICEYEQKGVDVAITTHMLTMGFNRGFDQAILCSGDGDFVQVVRHLRDYFAQRVIVVGWASSISPVLRNAANSVVLLDDYRKQIIGGRDEDKMRDLPSTLEKS